MGLLKSLFAPRQEARGNIEDPRVPISASDDFSDTGSQTTVGLRVNPRAALRLPAYLRAVLAIADPAASLPLVLYRKQENKRERAEKHPVYWLLRDSANPVINQFVFWHLFYVHGLTSGNAYAEIQTNGRGQPAALWPISPSRVEANLDEDGILVYVVTTTDGRKVPIAADRMLHVQWLSKNGVESLSPVEEGAEAIGLGLAAQKFGASFFGHGATPGGVLEHPGKLGNTAYKRLKRSWNEAHGGLSNAQRAAILEEGMKWHAVGIEPEKAQFLQTREHQVEEIARLGGVQPHKVGDLRRSTFTNIEHQGIEFLVYSLTPWLCRVESECNRKLLTQEERREGGFYIEYLTDAIARGDQKARYEAFKIGREGGWLSVNDIRERDNMNPIEGGNEYLSPLNMQPVGAPKEDEKPKDVPPPPPKKDEEKMLRLVEMNARRIVHKEATAIRKALKRIGNKPAELLEWLREFYAGHAEESFPLLTVQDCAEAREQVARALDVEVLLNEWEKTRPASIARRYMEAANE